MLFRLKNGSSKQLAIILNTTIVYMMRELTCWKPCFAVRNVLIYFNCKSLLIVSYCFPNICFFLGGAPTSICHLFRPFVLPSIHPSVHLSSRALHTISQELHDLIKIFGTRVKWWYPRVFFFFSFFFFFLVFICQVIRGIKGQIIAQNEKQQLHRSCAISQEQ